MSYFTKLMVGVVSISVMLGGCGGGDLFGNTSGGQYNGLYRGALTRGNSVVTVYVNNPNVEIVVTDESGVRASFVGANSAALATSGSTATFTSLPLSGSDGQTAVATGTFSNNGTTNVLALAISGGVGFSGNISLTTVNTNTLYHGSYSGTFTSTYATSSTTVAKPAGAVTSLTIAPNNSTGGYTLNASGTTTDPSGNPVNFAVTNASVDPCGIVTNLTVNYTYSGGANAPVTNSYSSAYLSLGLVSTLSLTGFIQATTTNWPGGGITESDALLLTQTGTTP